MSTERDPATQHLLDVLADAGLVVSIERADDGWFAAHAQATDGEIWQVWAKSPYTAVADLARQVGFEIDDD
ncbi:MAG: hypothetical protein GY778_09440 [bacterium]|nr:hypothetical protein [bacterium]